MNLLEHLDNVTLGLDELLLRIELLLCAASAILDHFVIIVVEYFLAIVALVTDKHEEQNSKIVLLDVSLEVLLELELLLGVISIDIFKIDSILLLSDLLCARRDMTKHMDGYVIRGQEGGGR